MIFSSIKAQSFHHISLTQIQNPFMDFMQKKYGVLGKGPKRGLIIKLILSMSANFPDNKIIDSSSSSQQISLKSLPLVPQLPMRISCSPKKMPNSKKFFFPVRNQSCKQEDNKNKAELQDLLHRQKIMLLAQKVQFNQLLMSPSVLLKQNELLSFPSLEGKNGNFHQKRSSAIRQKQRQLQEGFKLEDIHKEYRSNILGNISAFSQQTNHTKYVSEKKIESGGDSQKKKRGFISTSKKNSGSYIQTRRLQRQEKKAFQSITPVPSAFSRIKSQKVIEQVDSPTKKYKKGYLAYQEGGHNYWQKITECLQKQAKITVQSRVLTAKRYYAIDLDNLEPIVAQLPDEEVEIASLTKIMTCYLAILIAKKYQLDLKDLSFRVPDWISGTPGTSAQLEAGDILSAYDLLFALMLPSGNDAALSLAEVMGKAIQRHRKNEQKRSFLQTFLAHMNLFSNELNLPQEWNNPHGLAANPNFSTAKAITALSALALRDQTFRMVVNTKQYEMAIKNDRYGLSAKKVWKNTNKLLQKEGWQGVKTGTTDAAGHCLMALRKNLLIVVLDCQTLSKRFSDASRLSDYILSHKLYQ